MDPRGTGRPRGGGSPGHSALVTSTLRVMPSEKLLRFCHTSNGVKMFKCVRVLVFTLVLRRKTVTMRPNVEWRPSKLQKSSHPAEGREPLLKIISWCSTLTLNTSKLWNMVVAASSCGGYQLLAGTWMELKGQTWIRSCWRLQKTWDLSGQRGAFPCVTMT